MRRIYSLILVLFYVAMCITSVNAGSGDSGNLSKTLKSDSLTDNAADLIEKGNKLLVQGKYDEALNAYDEALTLEPKNADAWNSLAIVLQKLGRDEEATFSFSQAKEYQMQNKISDLSLIHI